jgi:DNA adenine methylase
MFTESGAIAAPFPYFGGKRLAAATVWPALGDVVNYVEPFAGSAAMLLGAPDGNRKETINDYDGFVANFWRSVVNDPDGVAYWLDYPVSESDLEARHGWLVNRKERLKYCLEDPDFFDVKIAGWWCWGLCIWIGSGWCSGTGPHTSNGVDIVNSKKQALDLGAGRGINRQLPTLGAGRGINRQLPTLGERSEYMHTWMHALYTRMRDVRVASGDWRRVLSDSVTTRLGLTGIFLDPPYDKGSMDYGAGGMSLGISGDVREWCKANGGDDRLRIVLCGHAGEHDALLQHGWTIRTWVARKGYALTAEAVANTASETLWCSPHCVSALAATDLFADTTGS